MALLAWLMPVLMPRAFAYGGPCIDLCDDDPPPGLLLVEEGLEDEHGAGNGECGDCACCAHFARSLMAPPVSPRPPGYRVSAYPDPAQAVPSSEPLEILCVPKG